MRENKTSIKPVLINAAIALIAFLIQYNAVFSIKISRANPMLPLIVCIAYSMFSGELGAVFFALFSGMVTDSASSATFVGFNTVAFILISLAVSLTVQYLFNNNIRSGMLIALIGSALYYTFRFIFCIPKQTLENSVGYLLRYALPSVIYTAVFIIPLFYFEKHIFGKYNAR